WPAATDDVTAGVLHLAIPYDARLHLTINGNDVPSRPSFGVETAFDVDAPGTGVLAYEREASRSLWLAVQAVLWIAVLAVGIGAQASFVRRRAATVYDETLIDLTGAPPISVGVAGEVLGLPVWEEDEDLDGDDVDEPEHTITLPAGHEALAAAPGTRPAPSRPLPPSGTGEKPIAPRPRRDTTPPSGIKRLAPAAPDELDLAGLVASVDDDAPDTGPREPEGDEPEAPQP
ncbi:MAG TPA: hypothetical protein VF065_09770, partial [Ilumatobacter sp.]